MGKGGSKPIDLMAQHFSEVYKDPRLTIEVMKYKCTEVWPRMAPALIWWPDAGTFYEPAISRLYNFVTMEGQGSPDDASYAQGWLQVAQEQPLWIKRFITNTRQSATAKIMYARTKGHPLPVKKAILNGPDIDPLALAPPPYAPPSAGEEDGSPLEASGQPTTVIETGVHVPFTTSDLLNWKTHGPDLDKDPSKFVDMMEGIILAQNPTWTDLRQLSSYLLTGEQRRQVQQNLEEHARVTAETSANLTVAQALAQLAPTEDPGWALNTDEGRNRLAAYQAAFLAAVKKGKKRHMNMQKIHDVIQRKDETPGEFLERLQEAYRMHSPLDPEDDDNRPTVVMSYVAQSAPDIRMTLTQLKALADRVYHNRDIEEQRAEKAKMKEKACLLAAAIQEVGGTARTAGRGRGTQRRTISERPTLGRNQCAYCKEEGHWKQECPNRTQAYGYGRSNRGRGNLLTELPPCPSVHQHGRREANFSYEAS
uniref:CCHC-type domain-containing protein n=1 Tax=Salvator merianae TaxID=96440 RepID=A0A8D0E471_SALMN